MKRTDEPDSYYEPEHPDDRVSRHESQAWAQQAVDEFCEMHLEQLKSLLWTYADDRAQEKLDELREFFWSTPIAARGRLAPPPKPATGEGE